MKHASVPLSPTQARAIWLHAQKLDIPEPFGAGPEATRRAVEHLGYVQIDTINVIERSHHHILFSRIPQYKRVDLEHAQSVDKSVFEFWTHALAYVPTADYRFFVALMKQFRADPPWSSAPGEAEYKALLRRIKKEGALSIRDITDDVLVDKTHPWASRKPSKRALQFGFYTGDLTISKRDGMVKSYDLTARHFGWQRPPKSVTQAQYADYLVRRAVQAQGIVSVDSIAHGSYGPKTETTQLVEAAIKRQRLMPVHVAGHEKARYWTQPDALEIAADAPHLQRAQILSPFDPLVIQRKRLKAFFDYDHRFEAYVPPAKRVMGYFALPVLFGDEIVAAIDLKTDRQGRKLLMQKWTWLVRRRAGLKGAVEDALHAFERFQLA